MRTRTVHITAYLLIALMGALGVCWPSAAGLQCSSLNASRMGAANLTKEARMSCCGDACQCGERCPCAAPNDDAPSPNAPVVPTNDTRMVRLTLALFACTLPNLLVVDRFSGVSFEEPQETNAGRPSGRELLASVSRWTT